jgi:hypothetical protein
VSRISAYFAARAASSARRSSSPPCSSLAGLRSGAPTNQTRKASSSAITAITRTTIIDSRALAGQSA